MRRVLLPSALSAGLLLALSALAFASIPSGPADYLGSNSQDKTVRVHVSKGPRVQRFENHFTVRCRVNGGGSVPKAHVVNITGADEPIASTGVAFLHKGGDDIRIEFDGHAISGHDHFEHGNCSGRVTFEAHEFAT